MNGIINDKLKNNLTEFSWQEMFFRRSLEGFKTVHVVISIPTYYDIYFSFFLSKQKRLMEMKTLVVEYLKASYFERWHERQQNLSRKTDERRKAQSSKSRRASLGSVHISVH